MTALVRTYQALLLAGFQQMAQYRIQSLLWMLFAIIRPVIFLAAWVAIATAQGGSVAGYTVGDFAAYSMDAICSGSVQDTDSS